VGVALASCRERQREGEAHVRDGKRIAIFVGASEDEGLPERAYASGAADFTYKPIVRNDLIARLRKALRDQAAQGGASARLKLRREERVCTIDGCEIPLTRHERDFLACLIDAPRGFASYGELIAAVWGAGAKVETQYLRVLAAQVRRKIEQGGGGRIVVTVVGEGYRLNA
jgi:DNA-binding response OmpR family regulator